MLGVKRKNIACLLFLLYIGYYSAMAYYIHIHVYMGVVYVHSHPYKKAQNTTSDKQLPFESNHEHNAANLFSFNQLSNILSSEGNGNTLTFDIIPNFSVIPYKTELLRIYTSKEETSYSLRAPPYSLS